MTVTTLSTLKITNKTRRIKKHLTDLTQYTQLMTIDCSRRIKSLLFPLHIAYYIGVTLRKLKKCWRILAKINFCKYDIYYEFYDRYKI